MFNISDIVGSLMHSGISRSSNQRLRKALGAESDANPFEGLLSGMTGGIGSGGGLTEALSGFLGGGKAGGSGIGGVLGDVMDQIGRMGSNKNIAIGGLGALAGALMGGGTKSFKGALGGGAMAILGALAISALKGKREDLNESNLPLGLMEPNTPEDEEALEEQAGLVLKAMLNAAKVDGKIDTTETERILGNLEAAGGDATSRERILAEMQSPLEIDEIVAAGRRDPQLGAQLYAASLLAIEVDTPTERAYLNRLADAMQLPQAARQRLESSLGVEA